MTNQNEPEKGVDAHDSQSEREFKEWWNKLFAGLFGVTDEDECWAMEGWHARDAEIDRLKKALGFYAEEKNYQQTEIRNHEAYSKIDQDQGAIAREILGVGKEGVK